MEGNCNRCETSNGEDCRFGDLAEKALTSLALDLAVQIDLPP
jgi:predicted metal-binding protein